MPRHLRHPWGWVAGIILLLPAFGCGGTWSGIPKPAPAQAMADSTWDTLPAVALDTPGPGEALVYVFNVSRGTLFGTPGLAVLVDGNEVAFLSRETYTMLGLAPGQHLWYVAGGRLELTVDAGRTYFVACAYDLGAFWGWFTVDADAKVREIEEAAARMLLRTYSFATRDG